MYHYRENLMNLTIVKNQHIQTTEWLPERNGVGARAKWLKGVKYMVREEKLRL